MSKGKTSNVIVRVGDEDFNFDPRSRFSVKKTKTFYIEWNNKYNASKIDLSSSVQRKFDDMYLFELDALVRSEENVQRYEIRHMNKIIIGIKNSVIDSEIK